jgi:hypothetical protein
MEMAMATGGKQLNVRYLHGGFPILDELDVYHLTRMCVAHKKSHVGSAREVACGHQGRHPAGRIYDQWAWVFEKGSEMQNLVGQFPVKPRQVILTPRSKYWIH